MSDLLDLTFADDITNEENDAFEEFSEELRDIIKEMGYNVEEEELHEIEKDLRLLEENADVVDTQLFSCLMDRCDVYPTDPDQSIQYLCNMVASPAQPSKSAGVPHELDELIMHGYERLQEVYEDIKRYERLLGDDTPNDEIEEVSLLEAGTSGTGQPAGRKDDGKTNGRDDKENKEPSKTTAEEVKKITPGEENRLINKFLRANALRPRTCPEPGRLPFKHDQQLKLEQYRKEWAKLPPPGEQKRMALRWRVRELMLRRDIPQLRYLPAFLNEIRESEKKEEDKVEQIPLNRRRPAQWKP